MRPVPIPEEAWEFLQDDDIEPQHLEALTSAVHAMDEHGAGSIAMSALGHHDELLAMYAAVKVDGSIIGCHLDAAEARILWGVRRPCATDRREVTVIPEALGSEDGERWWARGHIDPMAMVLAVLVEQATHAGPDAAGSMLVKFRLGGEIPTQAENQVIVGQMVDEVRHYWCKPDPDNDERQLDCDADDPAAEAWTELAL